MSAIALHRRIKRLLRRIGAPATITRALRGFYDDETGLMTGGGVSEIPGRAMRTDGDPNRYEALGLLQSEAPTLIFAPDELGQLPKPGATIVFEDVVYTVRDVKPVGTDGRTVMAELVVVGGGKALLVGRVILTLGPIGISGAGGTRASVAQLRAELGDAALAGIWATDAGVKLNGSAVLAWDDARCSTSTGRLGCPGANGDGIDYGIQTFLDGLGAATFYVVGTTYEASILQHFVGRHGNATGSRQFNVQLTSGNRLGLQVHDAAGVTGYLWSSAATFPLGTRVAAFFVFDGAAATDITKVSLWYALWSHATQSWGALTNDLGNSVTAGFPTVFSTPSAGTTNARSLHVGRIVSIASGAAPFRGVIAEARIWAGVKLTTAQMAATMANNAGSPDWVAPTFWPSFTTGLANLGTAGGVGAFTGNAVLVSDDTRWANPFLGGPASKAPQWSAANGGRIETDGFDDLLRTAGGPFSLGTPGHGLMLVTELSPEDGVEQRYAETSLATTTTALVLRNTATTNQLAAVATNGSTATLAQTPSALPGLRALHGRRTVVGATVVAGAQVGAGAEVTHALAGADQATSQMTVGTSRSGTLPSALSLAAVVLTRGGAAGQQDALNRFATRFNATI